MRALLLGIALVGIVSLLPALTACGRARSGAQASMVARVAVSQQGRDCTFMLAIAPADNPARRVAPRGLPATIPFEVRDETGATVFQSTFDYG